MALDPRKTRTWYEWRKGWHRHLRLILRSSYNLVIIDHKDLKFENNKSFSRKFKNDSSDFDGTELKQPYVTQYARDLEMPCTTDSTARRASGSCRCACSSRTFVGSFRIRYLFWVPGSGQRHLLSKRPSYINIIYRHAASHFTIVLQPIFTEYSSKQTVGGHPTENDKHAVQSQ